MPNLLIILGAGASYDFVPEDARNFIDSFLEFPLVNQLCEPKYFKYFQKKIGNLKNTRDKILSFSHEAKTEMRAILTGGLESIGAIHGDLMSRHQYLERAVSELWQEATEKKNKLRQEQLVAFAFYLHFLFYCLSEDFWWEAANNYNTIVSKMNDFLNSNPDSEILILNFNYDLLMNKALKNIKDDRIRGRLNMIKVHGSCDRWWIDDPKSLAYQLQVATLSLNGSLITDLSRSWPEPFARHPESYSLEEIYDEREKGNKKIIRPALILPFHQKGYLDIPCFPQDGQIISDYCSRTDRILVIGWSAMDDGLLSLMKEKIKEGISTTIVTGCESGEKYGEEGFEENFYAIKKQLLKHLQVAVIGPSFENHSGFSKFVRSNEFSKFFSTELT